MKLVDRSFEQEPPSHKPDANVELFDLGKEEKKGWSG
jgi:hypothetical protein